MHHDDRSSSGRDLSFNVRRIHVVRVVDVCKYRNRILGKNWNDQVEDLAAIGFLHKRPQKNSYIVPHLFRPGLRIRQGKAFLNGSNGVKGKEKRDE